MNFYYYFAWVNWRVLPNFVALVEVFPEFVEFLLYVSRDLFCQLFGVECCGDVGVVRRLGADETRDDPHGRGGGRGAPHEIHGGRRQALGQVLLIHGDGLLLDRGGVYVELYDRVGYFVLFILALSCSSLAALSVSLGFLSILVDWVCTSRRVGSYV